MNTKRTETKASSKDKARHSFLLNAPPLWALTEACLIGGVIFEILLWNHARFTPQLLGQTIFFLSAMTGFWFAIRLKILSGHRGWLKEGGLAIGLSLATPMTWMFGASHLGTSEVLNTLQLGNDGVILLLLGSGLAFGVARVVVRLWLFWERLRQRRIVWALTHIQLQLILAMAVIVAVSMTLVLIDPANRPLLAIDTWVFTLLPFAGVMSVMTVLGLLIVLPAAMLIAYLNARRTTERLETLTQGTADLRRGEYTTRLEVHGADEIAQLQRDFNAMATAMEQAMQDLQTERDRVAALLEARRSLVASVSHELRTPVATMRGYLDAIQRRVKTTEDPATLRPHIQKDLTVITRETLRLQKLIQDLFTLSRVEAGGLALDLRPIDAGEVVRRRVDALAPLAWQRQRVEVVAEIADDLPHVVADADRLDQVITNLLHNALRHTPPGGIIAVIAALESISGTTMTTKDKGDAQSVRIDVRDTGKGIPPETLPHIWERFYRGDNPLVQTVAGEGAGLGLAIVKELTEAMGGSVTVESTPGEGSCFMVRLNLAKGKA